MIKIIICDDSIDDANTTKIQLENLLNSKNITFNLDVYHSADNLLEKCEKIDFLFLDMEINGTSGIDIGLQLRAMQNKCHIIITSHFQKYLIDGYSIKTDRYILKPHTQKEFNQIVEPVLNEYLNENRYIIDEKIPGIKIQIKEILYLEYSQKHTYLYLKDRTIKTPYSLSYWIEKLHNEPFSQCYKSILVNLRQIRYIEKQDVMLENNIQVPVSRLFKKPLEQKWIQEMSKYI